MSLPNNHDQVRIKTYPFQAFIHIFASMNREKTLRAIKSTVHSFLPNAQVLLFGSQARGDFSLNSDYDLLLITEETYSPKEKIRWESKIRKALVWSLYTPFDVILQSREEIDRYKDSKGYITYYALKDAIEL